jgi:hypothetical protein
MKCEMLFCQNRASARFTAPTLKPGFAICQKCLDEQLAWSAPHRKTMGAVRVDALRGS